MIQKPKTFSLNYVYLYVFPASLLQGAGEITLPVCVPTPLPPRLCSSFHSCADNERQRISSWPGSVLHQEQMMRCGAGMGLCKPSSVLQSVFPMARMGKSQRGEGKGSTGAEARPSCEPPALGLLNFSGGITAFPTPGMQKSSCGVGACAQSPSA